MLAGDMAGGAGFQRQRFLFGKEVAGMAGAARGEPSVVIGLAAMAQFGRILQANSVASHTAVGAGMDWGGLKLFNRGHSHGFPSLGVAAVSKLLNLDLMAAGTGCWCRDFRQAYIIGASVLLTMAIDASHLGLAMTAAEPLLHELRVEFGVAFEANGVIRGGNREA
jgi:hypothetical protein